MASIALYYVGESIEIAFLTKIKFLSKSFGVESYFSTGTLNFSFLPF